MGFASVGPSAPCLLQRFKTAGRQVDLFGKPDLRRDRLLKPLLQITRIEGPDRFPVARLGRGTAPAYALVRAHVPFIERDAVMYPYLEQVRRLVAEGAITAAVDTALHTEGA